MRESVCCGSAAALFSAATVDTIPSPSTTYTFLHVCACFECHARAASGRRAAAAAGGALENQQPEWHPCTRASPPPLQLICCPQSHLDAWQYVFIRLEQGPQLVLRSGVGRGQRAGGEALRAAGRARRQRSPRRAQRALCAQRPASSGSKQQAARSDARRARAAAPGATAVEGV